jgi:hypothetical protein
VSTSGVEHFAFKPRSQSAYWYLLAGVVQLAVAGLRFNQFGSDASMHSWFLAAVFFVLGFRTWRNTWVEIDHTQFRITRPNILKLNEVVVPFAKLRRVERAGAKKLVISYDDGGSLAQVKVWGASADLDRCASLLGKQV